MGRSHGILRECLVTSPPDPLTTASREHPCSSHPLSNYKINLFRYMATGKMRAKMPHSKLAAKLVAWYAANRRDLPWRPPLGEAVAVDPYLVLVSEFMLQQTQVATV